MQPLHVIILYGANATVTGTVMEHVSSFKQFSRHKISYASISPFIPGVLDELSCFDVVVLHYSFFPGLHWKMSDELGSSLAAFRGLKVLFVQDEYDHTDMTRAWIRSLGIQCVYTCVPPPSLPVVYPPGLFAGVEFRQTLTGFAPFRLPVIACPPPDQREIMIGYRGRHLHPRYGDLAREKWLIGERMRDLCAQRGLRSDIESSEDRRIYGTAWYEFLASCRGTLGTESGSNVLDADGSVRAQIDAAVAADPKVSYEDLHARFIGEREGAICMNQVSPRIFEAVAMRTALVLFEGTYSGVVQPWEHYLPLRKDFANADEVFERLNDSQAIESMTARAYLHVIDSGNWSYSTFVREFDAYLGARLSAGGEPTFVIETIMPPAKDRRSPSMTAIPQGPTDIPFQLDWLQPELRDHYPALDRANAEFWNELCGTHMARELGIVDQSAASLARFDNAYLEFYPYLLERVPVHTMKNLTVLEVGLGYGTLGQCIVKAGADYIGLDIAELPVRLMRQRLRVQGLRGKVRLGSILNCPIVTESVDIVISIGCFHHTGDIERCIAETYRVLRPGGRAYIMVYNKFSLRQWLQWPRATLRDLVRDRSTATPSPAQGMQKKVYDTDLSGKAPPETVFVSRAVLRRMFQQFSRTSIRSENSDALNWRDSTIFRREAMLRLGWLWGLDLYVDAVK